MSKKEESNPLFGEQPEKAGSQTFADYEYQYHWALYKVLRKHENREEYAVFMELHEDVVFANSLDAYTANFEFSQVKTIGKTFTENRLVKDKKSGKSVLGKLLGSVHSKPFKDSVTEICLVSVSGFSIDLKNKGIKLEKIGVKDLSDSQVQSLSKAIKAEIGLAALPDSLYFVIPDLTATNYREEVIGHIAKVVEGLLPSSYYQASEIYRALIDDLHTKGVVKYDFEQWDDLLKRKALTSKNVNDVILEFTNVKDEGKSWQSLIVYAMS